MIGDLGCGCLGSSLNFAFWFAMLTYRAVRNLLKYMAMSIIALFVGVPKTIRSLARSMTERTTVFYYDETTELYKYNCFRATSGLIGGWMMWGLTIVTVIFLIKGFQSIEGELLSFVKMMLGL